MQTTTDAVPVLFLPGAGGSATFWRPVAEHLPAGWRKVLLAWPGLGEQPHDPAVTGIDDLVDLVRTRIAAEGGGPVDLVAQSMGGVVAARLALADPTLVRRLVLVATSGGLDMARLGASNWRSNYRANFPRAASWITRSEAAAELPVERIEASTLLIWGDADDISPVAVGATLERHLRSATLRVVPGGDHDLAIHHADAVAEMVRLHLSTAAEHTVH